jgi:hypothetical protein
VERRAYGGTADEDRAQRAAVCTAAGRHAHVVPVGHDARDAGRAASAPTAEATEQNAVMLLIAVVPRRTTSSIAVGRRHDPLICRAVPHLFLCTKSIYPAVSIPNK